MTSPRYDGEARRLAHDVVDLLFDHVAGIGERAVVDWTSPGELAEIARTNAAPLDLVRAFAANAIQLHHPMYIGHQVCPPFATAAIADLVISVMNQSNAVWEMSPIGTMIEKEIVRWLADAAGYPETSTGTTVSGGSAANLTGLLAARARWRARGGGEDPVVITSADAHYSVARAAAIMGIARDRVLDVPTDDRHRIDAGEVERALERHRGRVLAIVGTAGSTATGAFDPLDALADLRDRYGTWLHVDAAHGASVVLSDTLRHLVRGLPRADSFSWDPHKMLWMPLSLGVILVREGEWLRRAFEADAPYLFHAEREEVNLGAMTIQCSRRSDAFKLWLTLRTHGAGAFASALEHVARVTRHLHRAVRDSGDFEPAHEPEFNIFCFRHRSDDATNEAMRERLIRSGRAWITSTLLKGRRVLRVTVINPATREAHVERLLDELRAVR